MTYDRALRLSIHNFHKTQDSKAAQEYLGTIIEKQQRKNKFLNQDRVNGIHNSLNSYIKWFRSNETVVVSSDFVLRDLGGDYFTLGGKISRLDVIKDGYRGVTFGPATPAWQGELRFPLIQRLLAEMYNRPASEMSIGFQELDGQGLKVERFSKAQIESALKEFKKLGRIVKSYATKYQGLAE
jgi:hypothetical protein